MVVAFALRENHHRSAIDDHFGRCDWYGIYNTDTRKTEYLENPNRYAAEGVGCTSVEYLMKYGIEAVVAGRFGSKVVELLKKNNIQMIIPEVDKTMEEFTKLIKINA